MSRISPLTFYNILEENKLTIDVKNQSFVMEKKKTRFAMEKKRTSCFVLFFKQ
jgi:hypothetical protein